VTFIGELFDNPYLLVEALQRSIPPRPPERIHSKAEVQANCDGRPPPGEGDWFSSLVFVEGVKPNPEAMRELALLPEDSPDVPAASTWRLWIGHKGSEPNVGAVTGGFLTLESVTAQHLGCCVDCYGERWETGAVHCMSHSHIHFDEPTIPVGTVVPADLLATWLGEMERPEHNLGPGFYPMTAAALIRARIG
jgi:hypothetical protein